jgi:hypothetical protein
LKISPFYLAGGLFLIAMGLDVVFAWGKYIELFICLSKREGYLGI